MKQKEQDYIAINRKLWNKRTGFHLKSSFYDVEGFINGKNPLNNIELELLGDIKGKSILHLQCHFGQDSLSLARMGATVTGVDFSESAIETARELMSKTGIQADFICCDIYDLKKHLDKKFDIVFTSYGTIGWLPDLDRWAGIVSCFLKPEGKFVFAEFHPVVWMFDQDFEKIAWRYFKSDAIIEEEANTYADAAAPINLESVSWNHGMAEVISSLLKNDLSLVSLSEFDYSPYQCFNGMDETAPGKFRIGKLGNKIPMVYALLARKKAT